ncbi:MAG: hypothetical protein ACLPQY_09790 [Streptosporangiaceae bacterium]
MSSWATRGQGIEALSRQAYGAGVSPLDFAEHLVSLIAGEVLGLDDADPLTVKLARRIIGSLLDAGWAMPAGTGEP